MMPQMSVRKAIKTKEKKKMAQQVALTCRQCVASSPAPRSRAPKRDKLCPTSSHVQQCVAIGDFAWNLWYETTVGLLQPFWSLPTPPPLLKPPQTPVALLLTTENNNCCSDRRYLTAITRLTASCQSSSENQKNKTASFLQLDIRIITI